MLDQLSPIFSAALSDPEWDPATLISADNIAQLHRIVEQSGERVEGNLFTLHQQHPLPEEPEACLLGKRRNFALYVVEGSRLLEIGFNAGHSCLLALSLNPALNYVGVDIGEHAYTKPCFQYIQSLFPGRADLIVGDSRDVLPLESSFDRFHVDGGHGADNAARDIQSVIAMAAPGSVILIDDMNQPHIDALGDWFELRGELTRLRIGQIWNRSGRFRNEVFRVESSKG